MSQTELDSLPGNVRAASNLRVWKPLRYIPLLLACVLVIPTALLALGMFFSEIPYLGSFGTYVFPILTAQIFLLNLLGLALAFLAVRLGVGRIGVVFAVIGLLSAAAAAVVLGGYLRVAAENGVSVNVLAAFAFVRSGQPDETVAYTQVDGHDLLLDIYRPNSQSSLLAPVVLYVHGGGWIINDRREQSANMRWFADQGYLAIAMDYELATPERATWNTAGAQVGCAMVWIAENAARYGGDPEQLFAFGASAGGGMALTATYAAVSGVAESSCGGEVPTVRAVAAQVPAVDLVSFYENPDPFLGDWSRDMVNQYLGGSPSEYPERVEFVSPFAYITPDAPPTLITLAANDHLVPIEGTLQFIAQAEQAGVNVRAVTFPWADHTVGSVVNEVTRQLILQHFQAHGMIPNSPSLSQPLRSQFPD